MISCVYTVHVFFVYYTYIPHHFLPLGTRIFGPITCHFPGPGGQAKQQPSAYGI